MTTLLVELQTEELPPKALKVLADAFAARIEGGLRARRLIARDESAVTRFASPRRLGVALQDVLAVGAAQESNDKLMPVSIAFDAAGEATTALRKRLAKEGCEALLSTPGHEDASGKLYREGAGKAAAVYLRRMIPGATLDTALETIVAEALAHLPVPKRMSYQRRDDRGFETTVQFVRPAHGLLALHGDDIVAIRVLGLDAGRDTIGHRFLGMRRMPIASADDYAKTLRDDGKVIASFDDRRALIRTQLAAVAGSDRVVMPDALLDEVTALVEWPAVYRGTFDAAFLDVPQECLVLTMQQNQKYFALTDAAGKLVDRFLVVSNIETDEPSRIVGGNERVLRARLADAKFFYDQDRRTRLADRVDRLKKIVYHNQLGSQYERMERVERLAERIAVLLDANVEDAARAARLAKADLVTDMVGEFPELQGLMGRYYATDDGEKTDVAQAIEEQYRPRFAGDALPTSATGTVLALADKLETLVGLFGIGAVPTGDKDPFALRRHALGVIRMLTEGAVRTTLDELLLAACDVAGLDAATRAGVRAALIDFFRARLVGYLRELGYSANEVDAVVADIADVPLAELPRRLAAVRAFAALPESASLAAADKRVRNILAKSGSSTSPDADARLDPALLTADAEVALARALDDVGPRAEQALASGDFAASLLALASLRQPVDRFFDEVMVNADDPAVRANRLGLLARLHRRMNRVADLSKLAA